MVWIREFLLGRTQRVRVGDQLSAEVKVTSGVPRGSVLGPAGKCIRSSSVPSLRKLYLEEYGTNY